MSAAQAQALTARRFTLGGIAEGAQGLALYELLAKGVGGKTPHICVHVAVSDRAARNLVEMLPFYLPELEIIYLPAWDCLPYDRAGPNPAIVAARMDALSALCRPAKAKRLVVTTASAVIQRLPPMAEIAGASFRVEKGAILDREGFAGFLADNGYIRVGKAMEAGEYAIRGGIIDLIPPGDGEGVRIDLFGDEVESLKSFDPMTQRSGEEARALELRPMSEALMGLEHIERFRSGYRDAFGAVSKTDLLYEGISESRRVPGMEHWLPLFYEKMDTLFDYAPGAWLTLDLQAEEAIRQRQETIADYYQARVDTQKIGAKTGDPYHPLPPQRLYLMEEEWQAAVEARELAAAFSAFESERAGIGLVAMGMRQGVNFAALRKGDTSPFAPLQEFMQNSRAAGKAVVVAALSNGSRERLMTLVSAQGIHAVRVENYREIAKLSPKALGFAVLPIERGFEAPGLAMVSEQDLLGERVIRAKPKKRKADAFLAESAGFQEGELVVHKEHGIGRFEGLVTVEAGGGRHDCLKIIYEGEDKLFLPVENIDLITRYGSEEEGAKLDKLGGASWQARKARLKERIKIAAEHLIRTAAQRALKTAPELESQPGSYEAFCARFPYAETEDQERSIEEVIQDLRSGKPMDRLICGDVGFGKTEVALRAAFVATHAEGEEGRQKMQVAVVTPTTLLCRQHFRNFRERFDGFGVKVAQLSRLVSAKEQKQVKEGLKDGSVDIVVGTHALLSKTIDFHSLGLVIVDEEQHFGVGQKERLKELKSDVHVLTLSATPIPRTLQMALTGVRDLSLITTPPVDRLAVRSFVIPFDPVVIREAVMREKNRDGRVFLVTPRIQDMPELAAKMRELVPEIKIASAHGQMPASELDEIMNDFYDGKYDMLLSTAIIESGLDIPQANTMIIHRADRFGLSQLYQMRGRVGRGKMRAYAYFLLPAHKVLGATATRRLEVMQTLDSLGAGFTLASHDMDIRGFGNLVGDEQSGHIREVGIELYQQMLMDAVEDLRRAQAHKDKEARAEALAWEEEWSPQINLGMSVLIPEEYVADLQLRLGLYKRLGHLKEAADIDAFAAELIDRFGVLPEEVEHLLATVRIKQLCREAGVERIDAGPKGMVLAFRPGHIRAPEKLMGYIAKHPTTLKLRPDEKLVHTQEWTSVNEKIGAAQRILEQLCRLNAE